MCVCVYFSCAEGFLNRKDTKNYIKKLLQDAAGSFLCILLLHLPSICISFFVVLLIGIVMNLLPNDGIFLRFFLLLLLFLLFEHFLNKFPLIQKHNFMQIYNQNKITISLGKHFFSFVTIFLCITLLRWCYFVGEKMRIVFSVPFG